MAYRTDGRPSVPILQGGVWPIRPDGTIQEEEEEVEEKKVEEPKEASTLRPPRPQLPKPKPTTRFVPSASTLRPRPHQLPKPKPKPRFVPSLGSLRPPSPSAKPKPRCVPSVLTFPDPGPFNFNNLPDEVPLVGEEGYHAPPNSPSAEPQHPDEPQWQWMRTTTTTGGPGRPPIASPLRVIGGRSTSAGARLARACCGSPSSATVSIPKSDIR